MIIQKFISFGRFWLYYQNDNQKVHFYSRVNQGVIN